MLVVERGGLGYRPVYNVGVRQEPVLAQQQQRGYRTAAEGSLPSPVEQPPSRRKELEARGGGGGGKINLNS